MCDFKYFFICLLLDLFRIRCEGEDEDKSRINSLTDLIQQCVDELAQKFKWKPLIENTEEILSKVISIPLKYVQTI